MNTRCAAIAALIAIATLSQACNSTGVLTGVSSSSSTSTRDLGTSAKTTVTVTLLQIAPPSKNLSVNQSQQFVATGGSPPYAFSISSGIGTVSSAGLYQAPGNSGQAMIKVADAAANTAYAVVYVGETLAINPTSKTLGTNTHFTFAASGGLAPYTFSIVSGGGTIDPDTGLYTAPATSSSVVIRVTDFGGASTTSSVTVTPVLTISPTPRYVPYGQTAQFSATGGTGPYSYSLIAGSGAVTSSGLFTAAAATSTSLVRVTDAAGSTSDATVYSYQGPAISPTIKYVAAGQTASFGVTGGISPYTFSIVLGGGSLNSQATSTAFTADAAPGDTVVRVTDGGGNTSDATVHTFVPRKLALASEHACALTRASLASSTVNCWGRSQYGQRGDEAFAIGDQAGEMGDALAPIKLGTGLVPDSIVGTYAGAFVKFTNGTVKGWGYASNGSLGNATGQSYGRFPNEMGDHLPYLLLGTGKTAKKIASNFQGSGGCAILDNADHTALGKVRCWGYNGYGNVGVGDTYWAYGYYPTTSGDGIPLVDLGLGRTAVDIAYGTLHACVILDSSASGSRVKCWGYNDYAGQLGYGDNTARYSPGPIVDLGDDAGDGSGNPYYAKTIAAGLGHNCAILNNDKVKCWGRNNYGQTGNGDNSGTKGSIGDEPGEMGNNLAFVDLGTGRTAKAISCGYEHTCAILDNNKLKCWGKNDFGQVGIGDTVARGQYAGQMGDQLPYVDLGQGRTAKKIRLGTYHTCAILDNDKMKCWGYNISAQLGLGHLNNVGSYLKDMGDNLAYVDVGTGRTVKDIAPQNENTCALLDNNTVKCWGTVQSDYGPLGDENGTLGDAPGEMAGLKAVNLGTNRYATDIEANSSTDYTCSILNTGELKCWGPNSSGKLGTGGEPPNNLLPNHGDKPGTMGDGLPTAFVGFGRTVKQVSTGASSNASTCTILDDGAGTNSHLKCWGDNGYGQLGLENTTGYAYLEQLASLPYVNLGTVDGIGGAPLVAKQVSSGYYAYRCALVSNGGVKCWGNSPWGPNPWGNLGYGNNNPRGDLPATMGDNLPYVNLGTDGSNNPWQVIQLSTSYAHSCALIAVGQNNNQIKCWGYNAYGQLGVGDTVNRGDNMGAGHLMGNDLPFVSLGTGRTAKKVVTGTDHTCALLDNSQIKCWGYNGNGQLGIGDSSGNYSNISDQAGEMGDNLHAVSLGTGRTALDVFVGNDTTCAVLDNNGVKCWGYNYWGQLGIGVATRNTGNNPLTLGDFLPYTLSPTVPGDTIYTGPTSDDNLVYNFDHPVTTARSLVAGGALTIELSGGTAPYSFTLLTGGGTLTPGANTALFAAPTTLASSPSDTTVQVADSNSHVTTLTIHVFLPRKIAAGDTSTCVVDPTSSTSSNTKCFGRNTYGQLGNEKTYLGAKSSQMGDGLPAVDFGTDSSGAALLATAISAGQTYTCAILQGGSVKCFGYNGYGALANATNATSYGSSIWSMGNNLPFALLGTGKTVASISSDLTNDWQGFSCAIFSGADAGKVKCWGPNYNGELGTGNTTLYGYYPSTSGDNMPFLNLGSGRTAVKIAVGRNHACAVLDNGTVKCWGYNGYGELGLGNTTDQSTPSGPVDLGTGRTAVEIGAGYFFTCALLDNGGVKCWGRNDWGNLGYENGTYYGNAGGTMGDNLPEVNLGSGRTARHIAVGHLQVCAILDDNGVKCWGYNGNGELGLGNTNYYGNTSGTMGDNLPYVSLGTGRTATAIAMGANHSCVILDDGGMKCWGYNTYGELGVGDLTNRGDSSAAGHLMGDALPYVNLGSGANDKAAAISTGNSHTCALLQSGRVKCWGQANGEFYHATSRNTWVGDEPGEMGANLESVNLSSTDYAVDAVMGASANNACVLMNSGKMKCFGYNGYYQLGVGDGNNRGDTPAIGHTMGDTLSYVDLGTGRTVKSIKQTAYHTCAILDDHASGSHLKCWGYGAWGSLGYENTDYRGQSGTMGDALLYVDLGTVNGDGTGGSLVARQVSGVTNNCAILNNGRIKCWGYNSAGELGLGDNTNSYYYHGGVGGTMGDNLPYVNLGTVNGDGTGGALSATQVASGYQHTCALFSNGKVKCWGYNGYGQLGTGNSVNRGDSGAAGHEMGDSLPYTDLGTGRTAKKLALGYNMSCALLDNGRVKCWGNGNYGELGIPDGGYSHGYYSGDMGDRLVAVDLGTDAGDRAFKAIDIAVGSNHGCALLDDNSVKCWGYNLYGELGLEHNQNVGLSPLSLGNNLPAIRLQ